MKENQRQLKRMYKNLEKYARNLTAIDPEQKLIDKSKSGRKKQAFLQSQHVDRD